MAEDRSRKAPRPDPRAEKMSIAPPGGAEPSVDVVGNVQLDALSAKPAETEAAEPVASPAPAADPGASGKHTASKAAPVAPTAPRTDPRWRALEQLLAASDWAGVSEHLGTSEATAPLPPGLALVYAIARKEKLSANTELKSDNQQAIEAMAALLGVAPDSAAALVLTKRLLRRNPVGIGTTPAPGFLPSLLITVLFIALGGVVGYVLSFRGSENTTSGRRGVLNAFTAAPPAPAAAPTAVVDASAE